MTVILDPGTSFTPLDPFSYDATPKLWRLTAGQWKTQAGTDGAAAAATLATRTSERDSARNSIYVSGTYLSGQTWQTKDGASQSSLTTMTTARDTAITERNTANALAAARLPAGTGGSPVAYSRQFGTAILPYNTATGCLLSSALTCDRTGYWTWIAYFNMQTGGLSGKSMSITCNQTAYIGSGTVRDNYTFTYQPVPTLLTVGAAFSFVLYTPDNPGWNFPGGGEVRLTFVPTPDYPH